LPKFGDNLRFLREANHLSRKQLSQAVGMSISILGGYETGKVSPTLPKIIVLADYFGVTLDSLIGRGEITRIDTQKLMNALSKIYKSVKRIEEKK
jgi:transcriptional regulator with XRE-family HTH domain